MDWYYADQGQQKGPVDDAALDELVRAGVVRDDTLVWRDGLQDWQSHRAARGGSMPAELAQSVRPAVSVAAAGVSETRYCGECGRPFPSHELVSIGAVNVCATCKPVYLQRLREGGGQAVSGLRYAGFWIRFLARLIDAILLNVVFLVIRIPFGVAMFSPMMGGDGRAVAAALSLTLFLTLMSVVAAACYEIFFIARRGATIGKMILGLKVVRADGSPVDMSLAVGRYFAQFLSSITFMIGFIMAGFDEQKRALHDRICETRVIHTR